MQKTGIIKKWILSVAGVVLLSACVHHKVDAVSKDNASIKEVIKNNKKKASAELKEKKRLATEKKKERKIASQKTQVAKREKLKKPEPYLLGWIEEVKVKNTNSIMKAKLDSGAHTSSISAEVIKTYVKDGKRHVVYRVLGDDSKEEIFESEVIRWVRIKKKEDSKGFIRRPVVKMKFCVGHILVDDEVNLADRQHLLYPILIGRNMLEGKIVVDSSKTFTQKPECK